MLDEKDLQAISKLVDERIEASEARMTERIEASEARTAEKISALEEKTRETIQDSESRLMAMMEAYFEPRFNLLGEQIKLIQEQLTPKEALEDLEDRVDVVEVVVKQHSRDLAALKAAQ